MKTVKLVLSTVLFLNSAVSFAGPREDARVAIAQSHAAAKVTAKTLLQSDLDTLITNIVTSPSKKFPGSAETIPQMIQDLNQKVLDQLNRRMSVEQLDLNQLRDLADAYQNLVRERFKASFKIQDLVTERTMNLRAFELPFEGFAAMCKSGKSYVDAIRPPGAIPRIPSNQYSFNMSYGDSGYTVSASSSSANPASQDRNTVSAVLGTSAGIASSIALTGGAGATVAMATVAAPYLLVAFVAFSTISAAISSNEEAEMKTEAAAAELDLFMGAATDRDVARYYNESCKEVMTKLAPVYETVHNFYQSDEKRAEIQKQMLATQEARRNYVQDAEKLQHSQKLLELSFQMALKKCDSKEADAPCERKGNVFVSKADPSLTIDADSKDDAEKVMLAKKEFAAFTKQYPQELILLYQTHFILETMYNNWEAISRVISNSSLGAVDQAMSLLSHKLKYFVIEAQKAKDSSWSRSTRLTGTEQKLQDEFFSLRAEYFQLLKNALKIFFNKTDAASGKAQFKQFFVRFQKFSAQTIVNPDVRAMSESVNKLKEFYENL